MNNNFDLKQFLAEGCLLNEIQVNKPGVKYILIINDGSDELGNMHGITSTSINDFRRQFEDMFGESPENYGFAGSYLKINNLDELNNILDISDRFYTDNNEEISYLESLADKAVSWNEIQNIF
jgi:hypothetical protein